VSSGLFDADEKGMDPVSMSFPTQSFQGLPGRQVLTSIKHRTALLVSELKYKHLIDEKLLCIDTKDFDDTDPFTDL
jgi:hypothetical protein